MSVPHYITPANNVKKAPPKPCRPPLSSIDVSQRVIKCMSVYTHAFLGVMTKNKETGITFLKDVEVFTDKQVMAYELLLQALYGHLFDMDCKKITHLPESTISLTQWGCNLASLSTSLKGQKNNVEKTMGLGDSPQSILQGVLKLSCQYLDSYPGDDEDFQNEASGQNMMRNLVNSCNAIVYYRLPEIENLFPVLNYRLRCIAIADEFVAKYKLRKPDGKTCGQYNFDESDERPELCLFRRFFDEFGRNLIIPQPYGREHRYPFTKPQEYLVLAFAYSGYNIGKMIDVITKEADLVERALTWLVWSSIECDDMVWSKKADLFAEYGQTIGVQP